MAYKEVKLEKGGGKALYDALTAANDAVMRGGKAKAEPKKAPAKKPAPKKK